MGLRRWLRSACCCCPCRCLEEPARPEKEPLVRCVPAWAGPRGVGTRCPLNRARGYCEVTPRRHPSLLAPSRLVSGETFLSLRSLGQMWCSSESADPQRQLMPLGNGTDWSRAGKRNFQRPGSHRVKRTSVGFCVTQQKKFGYQCHDRKKSSSATGLMEIFLVIKIARAVPGIAD